VFQRKSMSIKIIKAGILDTVQDGGRYGYRHLGINPTGAMDKYAMQVANALVGNELNEAVMELHFPASVFLFLKPMLIAISGADFSASINGESVPPLHPVMVNRNDVLQFHRPVNGSRAYIAVSGGFELPAWLNSCSTNLKAAAGGYKGRKLQKEDELIIKKGKFYCSMQKEEEYKILPWYADILFEEVAKETLVLSGNEWGRLTEMSKETFCTTPFIITKHSDRMGYRLLNNPLSTIQTTEVISAAVCFGTVQLLPDGKLIVLMADHQTTGGYPRIAHVITAHHSKLAQLKAGDGIWFRLTDLQTAEDLLIKQQQHLLQLQNACTFRLQEYFNH
jgi:antagonist of KipI